MQEYESKQQQIHRPASQVYTALSDFNNFTPIMQSQVEGWSATEDSCSFKVKGMTMELHIVEKTPYTMIKLGGGDKAPVEFNLWIQFKEVAPADTRMRLVLHTKLNMMMKMMIGSKIQGGIDQMAEQIAKAFNSGAGF